jgi:hypothetical protein
VNHFCEAKKCDLRSKSLIFIAIKNNYGGNFVSHFFCEAKNGWTINKLYEIIWESN